MNLDDDPQVRALIGRLRQAVARGDAQDADRLFHQAQAYAPRHPRVINEAAMRSFMANQGESALRQLERLVGEHPSFADAWMNLAVMRRTLGRYDDALVAFDRVIALEPKNVAALLEKAGLQEEKGDQRAAALTYFAALQATPPRLRAAPPPGMHEAIKRAERAVAGNYEKLETFLENSLAGVRAQFGEDQSERFERCVDLLLKKRAVYRQQPTFLHFPGLPVAPLHDRADFPWLGVLEEAANDIRAELEAVLDETGVDAFAPYAPDAQGAQRWRCYPFWREGAPYRDHMARCPRTMEAIAACPNWDAAGLGPNAMFSILEPHASIRPHTGPVNVRLVAHLGLIVPDRCAFRVGGEVRRWRSGEAFVFDDSIEHEAWNESDQMRAILIVDVWAPSLSSAEREMLNVLCAQVGQYYGTLRLPGQA